MIAGIKKKATEAAAVAAAKTAEVATKAAESAEANLSSSKEEQTSETKVSRWQQNSHIEEEIPQESLAPKPWDIKTQGSWFVRVSVVVGYVSV